MREDLRYKLIHDAPNQFLSRWIDAAGKRDRFVLVDESWGKDVKQYRDKFFTELGKGTSSSKPKYSMEEYKAMNIQIELGDFLNFGIILTAPDGSDIWI